MGLSINQNIAAVNSYRNLSNTQNDLSKSLEKLSSGFRINRAADDAAGLAISEGLRSQVGGLKVAARNAQDGISVVQTAEGALTEVHAILQRVRDLAVQGANDSNNTKARENIQTESDSLVSELDRIGKSTNFNGTNLLDGSQTKLTFQVGAGADSNSQITVDLSGASVTGVATALKSGSTAATGTSFDIAAVSALTTGAATFTSTKGGPLPTDPATATTVTTGTLDFGKVGTVPNTTVTSVEDYANALRSDANFAANFTVSVNKDANGAGTGITVKANDGGKVAITAPGVGIAAATAPGTSAGSGLKFDSAANAQDSIKLIDAQIEKVSTARAGLGAVQNRLEHTIKNVNVAVENLSASESRIRDTDMASEMVSFTRAQILSQAGTAMLAQANQIPQGVLSLLR
ncbi:flagellin N-terminal helical domain-containing protein [Sanguibacter suarezii]|uniref:flagellin N-terminal helical domain-containing protein n=1 Tax=Sanguibacter suarezii TaxID=60921 RepID=UPI00082C5430|nr:flagellin [Sanguibacter suarezii]